MSEATHAPGFTLQLMKMLAASPADVFELLSEADQVMRWFGPHGYTATHVDLDLRVDGTYRITMRPSEGADFHIGGAFTQIFPRSASCSRSSMRNPVPTTWRQW